MSTPDPIIAAEGVARRYTAGEATITALDGVSLHVEPGAYIALLGRSGSGKSTLLNILCGIDRPSAGTVLVNGEAVHLLQEPALTLLRRRTFGFIFQFFNLLPTLTVLENILLPGQLAGGSSAQQLKTRAMALLDRMGLASRAEAWPDRLSGGEQQRVAICRALLNDPPILLADEPTGNLDTETGTQVLDLLQQLHREEGKTILLVTHSPEAATRAQRQVMLQDGRLIADSSGQDAPDAQSTAL